MNPRRTAGLASLILGAFGLSGCSEPVRNDGHMFERWADAVAAVRIDDGARPAATTAPTSAGVATGGPTLKIDLTDAPSSKDLGLRAAVTLVDSELAGLRRNMSGDGTPAPAPAPASAQAESAGGFMAQLAAFPNRQDAERGWARLKAAHPDVLAQLAARYEPVDLGGRGVWTRLQAGPFPSRSEAAAVCVGLGVAERLCVTSRRG